MTDGRASGREEWQECNSCVQLAGRCVRCAQLATAAAMWLSTMQLPSQALSSARLAVVVGAEQLLPAGSSRLCDAGSPSSSCVLRLPVRGAVIDDASYTPKITGKTRRRRH